MTKDAEEKLLALGFDKIDYLTVRDTTTLQPVEKLTAEARILVAAKIGQPRLLDNMLVEFKG